MYIDIDYNIFFDTIKNKKKQVEHKMLSFRILTDGTLMIGNDTLVFEHCLISPKLYTIVSVDEDNRFEKNYVVDYKLLIKLLKKNKDCNKIRVQLERSVKNPNKITPDYCCIQKIN